MYTKTAVVNSRVLLGAAIIGCTLVAADAAAGRGPVTVAFRVTTQGINPSEPAGAHELYRRLDEAARFVCTRADRVGLEPSPDPEACHEQTLGRAIRSAHMPLVTLAYLRTHSIGQAAEYGIDVPAKLAHK
jgi:UrcA family protein